ncbi:MAG: O-antigen ligase family protein [Acidimicrobiales bacterium]
MDSRRAPTVVAPPAVAATCVAIVLAASPAVVRMWSPGSRGYFNGTLLLPADIGLLAVLVLCGPTIVAAIRHRTLGPAATGWLVLAGALAAALLWHPSGRGVIVVLQIAGAGALAATFGLTWRTQGRRALAATVCAVGLFETGLAVAQRVAGGRIGLPAALEAPVGLYRFGNATAPNGSFPHPYLLAAASLVCVLVAITMALDEAEPSPLRWALLAAVCAVPLGMTCSRGALLGAGLLAACLVLSVHRCRWSNHGLAVLCVVALGVALPAALTTGGWLARAKSSTASVGTGRGGLTSHAITMLREHPAVGVGPGRYVFALEPRFGLSPVRDAQADQAVHDLPLLAGAEGGLVALGAAAGALGWTAWRARRTSVATLGVFLAFLPFCLLDQLAYVSAQGVVASGIWLGLVDGLILTRRGAST